MRGFSIGRHLRFAIFFLVALVPSCSPYTSAHRNEAYDGYFIRISSTAHAPAISEGSTLYCYLPKENLYSFAVRDDLKRTYLNVYYQIIANGGVRTDWTSHESYLYACCEHRDAIAAATIAWSEGKIPDSITAAYRAFALHIDETNRSAPSYLIEGRAGVHHYGVEIWKGSADFCRCWTYTSDPIDTVIDVVKAFRELEELHEEEKQRWEKVIEATVELDSE